MEAYFQVACFNCCKAGNCGTKGKFSPDKDLIPCYEFSPKTDVLTSAVKAARAGVYKEETEAEVQANDK